MLIDYIFKYQSNLLRSWEEYSVFKEISTKRASCLWHLRYAMTFTLCYAFTQCYVIYAMTFTDQRNSTERPWEHEADLLGFCITRRNRADDGALRSLLFIYLLSHRARGSPEFRSSSPPREFFPNNDKPARQQTVAATPHHETVASNVTDTRALLQFLPTNQCS